jgi:hypothetical protein
VPKAPQGVLLFWVRSVVPLLETRRKEPRSEPQSEVLGELCEALEHVEQPGIGKWAMNLVPIVGI